MSFLHCDGVLPGPTVRQIDQAAVLAFQGDERSLDPNSRSMGRWVT